MIASLKWKLRTQKALLLFLIGLGVHILYDLTMIGASSRLSTLFQPDTGQLTRLATGYTPDSKSYIEPADNFIEHGIFGDGKAIDHHRTLGYPLILSLFKITLGQYWYYGLVLLQTLLGALIYPLCFCIGKVFFRYNEKLLFAAVLVILLTGGYFTKDLYILTDLSFSFFFLLGVYMSILAVVRPSSHFLIFPAILLLTFGGLIRPAMTLYPIASALLLVYVSRLHRTWNTMIKRIVWGSTVVLIFSCNYSAFRIYHYDDRFTPTDVVGINMFDYSVKNILTKEGKANEYMRLQRSIDAETDWTVKDQVRKRSFFETIKKYPVSALAYWKQAAKSHLLAPHLMEAGVAFGFYKEEVVDNGKQKLQRSSIMVIVFYMFYALDVLLLILFMLCLMEGIFIRKDFLLPVAVLSIIGLVLGPSFIAATGARMRMPVEPFILIPAICFAGSKISALKNVVGKRLRSGG